MSMFCPNLGVILAVCVVGIPESVCHCRFLSGCPPERENMIDLTAARQGTRMQYLDQEMVLHMVAQNLITLRNQPELPPHRAPPCGGA